MPAAAAGDRVGVPFSTAGPRTKNEVVKNARTGKKDGGSRSFLCGQKKNKTSSRQPRRRARRTNGESTLFILGGGGPPGTEVGKPSTGHLLGKKKKKKAQSEDKRLQKRKWDSLRAERNPQKKRKKRTSRPSSLGAGSRHRVHTEGAKKKL